MPALSTSSTQPLNINKIISYPATDGILMYGTLLVSQLGNQQ